MEILSLFPNQKKVGEVIDELTSQESLRDRVSVKIVRLGLPENEVSDASQSDLDLTKTPGISPIAASTRGRPGIPAIGISDSGGLETVFSEFGLLGEEQAFIERSVRGGGQLLIVDTDPDYQTQTKNILNKHNGRGLYTKQ